MNNEKGAMLVVVIMVLALLSILGVSAIEMSNTELKIATSDLILKHCFFSAESGINSALKLLPSVLNAEDQIKNAAPDWQGNISKDDTPPFYEVSIKHKVQSGEVLYYGDTNGDYLLEYNSSAIGYPVEIIESHGTDYRGGKVIVNVGARYEEAFPMPKAALWVGKKPFPLLSGYFCYNLPVISGSTVGQHVRFPSCSPCPDAVTSGILCAGTGAMGVVCVVGGAGHGLPGGHRAGGGHDGTLRLGLPPEVVGGTGDDGGESRLVCGGSGRDPALL